MVNGFLSDAARISAIALLCSLALTPVVRAFARRIGAVAAPKADRWHKKPTAMMGGVAIVGAVMTVLLFMPRAPQSGIVILTSAGMFLLGLVDDFLHIKPYQKLIGQLIAAALVVYFGLVLPWTASPVINMMITFVWLAGITNAVNMLDNMDGLAAGICVIAAAFLGVTFYFNGQYAEALMLAGFAGALLGFLVYNHSPASIFMGDCGSMFIGFFLASSALLAASGGGGRSRSLIAVLAVPVLVLCIPIFDTTFVTLMRKLAGRAASQGGRDHTSHRLVALGLSEKHAVWMLYALALTAGPLALLVRNTSLDISLAAIAVFSIGLALLGVHLGRVRVYDEEEVAAARMKPIVSLLFGLSYKARIFEVGLDLLLITLSYYLAYALRFGPFNWSPDWQLFLKTLPAVICIKLATFLASGIYRGIWRYASLANVMAFVRTVALSSILTILGIVFAFRFEGFARTVFLFDGLFLLLLVTASRFTFKFLQSIFPAPHTRTGRRVLIFGAGDGGELLYRELNNNGALEVTPVAFADDDPSKAGRLIHGLRVVQARVSLADICRKLQIAEVLISTSKLSESRLIEIVAQCTTAGVPVSRAHMKFERLKPTDFGWVIPSIEETTGLPLLPPHTEIKIAKPGSRATADH
jgi:UDP-GlcNAc:undecaprenyl-phosphate/decaprenyl-phosphate GlcNAc-1-phosphate transferase